MWKQKIETFYLMDRLNKKKHDDVQRSLHSFYQDIFGEFLLYGIYQDGL